MFEFLSLFGILAVGSMMFYGFWAAFLIIACVLVGLTEKNHWGWATTLIIAGFVAMGVTHIFNVYQYALATPWSLVFWALKYIGIGLVWGAIKWWRFVTKAKKRYLEARDTFLEGHNAKELTDDLRVLWTKQLAGDGDNRSYRSKYNNIDAAPPEAKNNKETIINWMAFWPWSMLGTFLYDFLQNLWDFIYDAISGVYDSIAKAVFSDVSGDVLTPEQMEAAKKVATDPETVAETIKRTTRF